MSKDNPTTTADATVDHDVHAGLLEDLLARVASCFARRETRLTCRDMVNGFLMELEDHNCWTMAEGAGHPGPHRMQHLLSRARVDDQGMLDAAADWAAERLTAGQAESDVVLIVDETGDAKTGTDRSSGRSPHRSRSRRPCPSADSAAPEPGTHGRIADGGGPQSHLEAHERWSAGVTRAERASCKIVGSAYVGSNPAPATRCENAPLAAKSRAGGAFLLCPSMCHLGSL